MYRVNVKMQAKITECQQAFWKILGMCLLTSVSEFSICLMKSRKEEASSPVSLVKLLTTLFSRVCRAPLYFLRELLVFQREIAEIQILAFLHFHLEMSTCQRTTLMMFCHATITPQNIFVRNSEILFPEAFKSNGFSLLQPWVGPLLTK